MKPLVHELHRLSVVQKLLMKGDSVYTKSENFPMKRTLSENHSVGSTRFLRDSLFSQEDQDFGSRIQQIPLDLRLSIGYAYDDDALNVEEVDLSLSIGSSTNKRSRIAEKSWKNKIVYPSSGDVIDLEESSGIGSSEDALPAFSLDQSSQNSTVRLVNVVNLHQDPFKVDPSCSKRESLMNCANQGSNEWHDVKHTKLLDLDLNKDLSDDQSLGSYHLDEPSSDLTEEKEIKISEVTKENKKEDSDYAIQNAAHSLVSISLQHTSTSNQDSESKSESKETENKKTTPGRCSSIDSYESLVLKLEERNIDEDCVTSKVFEINQVDKKENGIKLRRGRRLKDFQKDILPTLSSLSRHEIWEDVKILEGVIRSREFKRLQKAKICKEENSFLPVKNKRLKFDCIGRKCSSRKKK